jgi:hypothetical protein
MNYIKKHKIEVIFYTNNLAGIDEIHKINPSLIRINERSFNLIGGQPLNVYRATTGESSIDFLKTIWSKQ